MYFVDIMIIFPSIFVILICSNLMIVLFSNLITRVLKKLNTFIFSISTITNLRYSIFPIFNNLIITIYKDFILEFYSWLISTIERKIISVNYNYYFLVNLK